MAGTFPFVVLNDLHYMSPECGPWLEGLVRQVNATPGVELVLVLGDLAETGAMEELAAAKRILDRLNVPYYTVPGNHDGPPERPLRQPGGDPGLAHYESLFPNRRNYSFNYKGWQFLALDTTNGSGWKELPIPEDALEFARHAAAALDKNMPTILFTHMPLDPTVRYASSQGYELLKILLPLNLRIVFSGHFHGLTEHQAPRPSPEHLKLLTNRGASRSREIHDGSGIRGYFLCLAKPDESVDYAFVEYRGA
ncbi:MAG TPA: metallophosphoesterase [Phycisphaerae bacterium]|jgi:predicted MPP superfamily phosphohydrolase